MPKDEIGAGRDIDLACLPPASVEEEQTEECGYSTGGNSYRYRWL